MKKLAKTRPSWELLFLNNSTLSAHIWYKIFKTSINVMIVIIMTIFISLHIKSIDFMKTSSSFFLTCLGKSCQGGSWTSWARSGWLKPGRVARRCCKILTKNFYFHFHYFFSTYSYRNAILRRFYSCHFFWLKCIV